MAFVLKCGEKEVPQVELVRILGERGKDGWIIQIQIDETVKAVLTDGECAKLFEKISEIAEKDAGGTRREMAR